MKLTKDNYYSVEADRQYMSVSQYKRFMECEAATMANIAKDREDDNEVVKSDALLFGSYVHSWLDGTMEEFKEENPDMFSSRGATKGQLKSNFKLADTMIKVLEDDPFCMMALDGEKEVIMTGELFGLPWKIRIDVLNRAQNRFADLKTVKDIHAKHWVPEVGYCSFVEAYGYITQMAVYSEIERQNRGGDGWLENYIVAVSKEDVPNKAVITIDEGSLINELEVVEKKLNRIRQVKHEGAKPIRCEKCRYCRMTKKVDSVMHYSELIE